MDKPKPTVFIDKPKPQPAKVDPPPVKVDPAVMVTPPPAPVRTDHLNDAAANKRAEPHAPPGVDQESFDRMRFTFTRQQRQDFIAGLERLSDKAFGHVVYSSMTAADHWKERLELTPAERVSLVQVSDFGHRYITEHKPFHLTVEPRAVKMAEGPGEGSFSVNTNGSWTVISDIAWLRVSSGPLGEGNGVVTFKVEANPKHEERVAKFTVAGHTVTVTQLPAKIV